MLKRLLILTGPVGSAKTATLRVLAREMDFEIVEYKDTTNTTQFSPLSDEPSTCTSCKILLFHLSLPSYQVLNCWTLADTSDAFATFLTRAGAYTSVFASARRKIVLLEDLPNILHPVVRPRFHDALRAHVERTCDVAPVVLVVSDAGVCAEGDSNGGSRDLVIDSRTVVPPGLSSPSHFSEIRSVRLRNFALFLIGADRCA
jgi:cell cycle checkpoint protein